MSDGPHALITLHQPPQITFGAGCRERCLDFLKNGGRSLLVVTSRSLRPSVAHWIEPLRRAGLCVEIAGEVPAEPDLACFNRLAAAFGDKTIDTVVGFGGGSVLDLAKLLAALGGSDTPVSAVFGNKLLRGRARRLVCLPTTAGAGSEVSPNAILLDRDEQLKKAVIDPCLVPDACFIDPELTLSLPPALTAATGIDALVHCIEAYANRQAHPMVDLYALEGIRLIAGNLLHAVRNGQDLAARSAVARGALYGGLCLGPVNTAAVHALSYPLGSEFGLGHGISNALLLPHVIRFNLPAAPERYAAVARALGVTDAGDARRTAEAGVDFLETLCVHCGLPAGIGACGVPRSAIPRMAKAAMKVTRLLRNNPRALSEEDAAAIYEKAFA